MQQIFKHQEQQQQWWEGTYGGPQSTSCPEQDCHCHHELRACVAFSSQILKLSKDRNALPSRRAALTCCSSSPTWVWLIPQFHERASAELQTERSTTLYQYIRFSTISTMVKQAEWKFNSPQHYSLKLCLLLSLQNFHFQFLVTCCSKMAMQHNL